MEGASCWTWSSLMAAFITISSVPRLKPLSASRVLALQVIGWIGAITLILLEVRKTPYYADDEPNSQIAAVLAYTHESSGHYIGRITRQWMTNEGRFFPMSGFEAVHLFTSVNSRLVYKSLQILVVVLCSLLVGLLVAQITKDRGIAVLSAGVMISLVQIRAWYDPTIAFSVLLPSVTIKILLAINLLIYAARTTSRVRQSLAILGALTAWSYAVFQYETAVLLFPAVIVAIWAVANHQRFLKIIETVLMSIPVLTALVISRVLRAGVVASPGYQMNLDRNLLFFTYIRQLFSALPFSYAVSDLGRFMPGIGVIAIALAVLVASLLTTGLKPAKTNRRGILSLVLIGCVFLLGPPITTAVSARWQLEVVWGVGYLVVFMQYVGLAILIAALIALIAGKLTQRNFRFAQVAIGLITATIVLGTATSNREVSNRLEPIATTRALFEDSVRDGIFNRIVDDSTIISPSTNSNGWVNPWYYQWLNGSRTHKFTGVQDGMVLACTNATEPFGCDLKGPWWGFAELPHGDRDTVDVIGQFSRLDVDFFSTELIPGTVYLVADSKSQLPLPCQIGVTKTRSGNWKGKCVRSVTSFKQVTNLLEAMG